MRSFKFSPSALFWTMLIVVGSARTAMASIIPLGSTTPVAEGLSMIYDPADGSLFVQAPTGKPLTAFEIKSSGGRFTGNCENLASPFDVCTAAKVFKLGTNGFESIDLGRVLAAQLSPESLLTDLRVDGASLPAGFDVGAGVFLVHPAFVPEPTTGCLLVLSGLAFLGVRRVRA